MLSLSTKYALKALMCLAKSAKGDFVQVVDLSVEADVPGPYLSKIMKQLAIKGIVESRRGKNGGVRYSNKANYTFYDICVALDDPIVTQGCFLNKSQCNSGNPCRAHSGWSKLKKDITRFLQESRIG